MTRLVPPEDRLRCSRGCPAVSGCRFPPHIIIDATIIRGILAPALVALLGRPNWWLPRPAARLLQVTPLTPAADGKVPAVHE